MTASDGCNMTAKKRKAPQSSKETWRISLRPPCLSTSSKGSGITSSEDEHEIVCVPEDGWYGLCFGAEFNCKSLAGKYSISLKWNEEQIQHSLPLKHPTKKGEEERLVVTQVGKLIYLKANTKVRVVQEIETTNANIISEEDFVQWCLIAMNRDIPFNGMSAYPHNTDDSPIPFATMHPSHLICTTCIRTFKSVHAILCHAREAHRPKHQTMWTEPLHVAYQDDAMVVVVKPQGMTVMGASPSLCRSDLLLPFKGEASDDSLSKPLPVHRLDAPTGGLLIVAKTKTAEIALKQAFVEHTCRKRYRALLVGKLEPLEGEYTSLMGGKEAHTKYKVVQYSRSADQVSDSWTTTVDLFPITGRRHQLRKHMKALGHPIWGDSRYGPFSNPNDSEARLCLWAMEITLPHPTTGEEVVVSMKEDPELLKQVVSQQEKEWKRQQPNLSPTSS